MRTLPSGTVTFLFTDVEGSTRLLQELGAEAYAGALAEHRRALRAASAAHDGVEVDTQGDAFFAAFARASDGVAAAADAQRALADGPVRVRIGLHTGEPIATEEGYVGVDVVKGARIAAAGHGGQVLISAATAKLVDIDGLRDLGRHRLKDLTAPARLFQLGMEDYPPLHALYETNLPVQPTPLLGRARELEEGRALMDEHRLVTLTGTGGSGKTRLGLQLAADAIENFPQGVFWIPLQAVTNPELVEAEVAATLGCRGELPVHIGDRRLLLVLDNLEHLLGCASRLADLMARTPNVKLLVTSREPLRINGEHRYPVEPLREDDAAALFAERARAVNPDFAATSRVFEICRRLDGLPLPIELAAAQASVLDVDGLLARLDRALPLLTRGLRDAPERQRTLRATIEWSYALLDDDEQRLFARIAVFVGGFELEAADTICGADLEVLAALVDKNLLQREGRRFAMLETIREYARERLGELAEAEELRCRHARHYVDLAVRSPEVVGAAEVGDADNLRAAAAWALSEHDLELLLTAAEMAPRLRVTLPEVASWFEAAVLQAELMPAPLRCRACIGAATARLGLRDFATARSYAEAALAEARAAREESAEVTALRKLGDVLSEMGDLQPARERYEQSLALAERIGDSRGVIRATHELGELELLARNFERSRALLERSVELAREMNDSGNAVANALHGLGDVALLAGDPSSAGARYREALIEARRVGSDDTLSYALAGLAAVAAAEGHAERAGLVWGAAAALQEARLAPIYESNRWRYESVLALVSGPSYEAALARGRELPRDEAIAFALSVD